MVLFFENLKENSFETFQTSYNLSKLLEPFSFSNIFEKYLRDNFRKYLIAGFVLVSLPLSYWKMYIVYFGNREGVRDLQASTAKGIIGITLILNMVLRK